MAISSNFSLRRLASATALFLGAALLPAVQAADNDAMAANGAAPATSAMTTLVKRMVERGLLTPADANELLLLSEAESAEARAQMAMAKAALAQAAATEARAQATIASLRAAPPMAAPTVVARVEPVEPPAVEKSEAAADVPAAATPKAAAPPAAAVASAGDDVPLPEDTVRVAYVPEFVKRQLREEIRQDVLDEARKEGWATPQAVPDWVGRFRFFGDLRFRYEGIRLPAGNDNTGAFPNFNAINTGAPFDTAGTVFSPQYNADQDRNRLRLRVRLATEVDLSSGFTGGLRLATGESNSPVTQNQSLGAAGSGQGGNFSKYAVWLDRGFIKYETGGLPDQDLVLEFGRVDNPFFSTSMLWADDLGFDGINAHGRLGLGEDVTTFFTLGAFPVFNTDLNFATNQPAKFKSNDKWLYAAQLGTTLDLGKDFSVKLAAAYYLFDNVEGRLSTPFIPVNTSDAGDTDASRPAFAQKGNTYMALRDIVPGPLNQNGTINQFQYFGLASKFHPLVVDARFEFNHFEPFQIALTGEYVRNLAFDRVATGAVAVNNLGPAITTGGPATFVGGNTAWLAVLTVGDAALQKRWDWNVNVGYRRVASDALIDGFADSDFGGGGTNTEGMTFAGTLALSPRVWLSLRWMSAREVSGPTFKNDIIQFDLNGKF